MSVLFCYTIKDNKILSFNYFDWKTIANNSSKNTKGDII